MLEIKTRSRSRLRFRPSRTIGSAQLRVTNHRPGRFNLAIGARTFIGDIIIPIHREAHGRLIITNARVGRGLIDLTRFPEPTADVLTSRVSQITSDTVPRRAAPRIIIGP